MKINRKHLIIAVLCCIAIAAGVWQAMAAYISVSNMKAVASTNENESLFNSNYLYGYRSYPTSIARNSIEFDNSDGTVSFTITIYNHHKQDDNLVNPSDVTYELELVATGAQGNDYSGYKVDGRTMTAGNSSASFTSGNVTIKGRKSTTHKYVVTMPGRDLDYAQFNAVATVKATSGGSTGTNIYCLAAVLAPSIRSQVALPSVEGRLMESGNIDDYDAFNYEITVGGNASDVKLSWDTDYVEIDPLFAAEHGIDNSKGEAELHFDIGTQIIQFYRKGDNRPLFWTDLGINVKRL